MKISLHTFCRNEARILPFFFQHYRSWIDHIVVNDNDSTDASVAICKANGAEVRPFSSEGKHPEPVYLTPLRNGAIQEAKRRGDDWLIVCDADELLWAADLPRLLADATERKFTLIRAYGWEMISSYFPRTDVPITRQVKTGVQTGLYSKPCLFHVPSIETLSFQPGAHDVLATGDVKLLASGGLMLLHYKRLGWEYYWSKVQESANRSAGLPNEEHFYHYNRPLRQQVTEFHSFIQTAVEVIY